MKYKYLLSFVVLTYNHPNETLRFIKSVTDNGYFESQIIIINDNSSYDYKDVKKFIDGRKNIVYIETSKSLHKFRNFYYNRHLFEGKYICFLDDKDIMITGWGDYLKNILSADYQVIVSDMINQELKILGKHFGGTCLGDFYFKKAGYGDKFIIFKNDFFKNFEIDLSPFKWEKIYNLDFYMCSLYDLPVYYTNQSLVIHEYSGNGISLSSIKSKQENYLSRAELIRMEMIDSACLIFKMYKCYEVWLIRHRVKFEFSSLGYKILYHSMFFSGVFHLCDLIFKHKLKKIIG